MTEEDTFEALQLRVVIDDEGTKRYYNPNNELHRKFGPAIIYADGAGHWYLNGKFHREDGPAIERANGAGHWYLNGIRHRTDGPALVWANGTKAWWINGEKITKAKFLKHPLCTIK